MTRRLLIVVMSVLTVVASVAPVGTPSVSAARKTYTWTGAGDGSSWGDENNWSGKEVPPAGGDNDIVITEAGESTITGATGQVLTLQIANGTILQGSALTITEKLTAVCARLQIDVLILAGSGEIAGGAIYGRFQNGGSVVHRPVRSTECLSHDGGMDTSYTLIAAGSVVLNDGLWRGRDGATLRGLTCCGSDTSSAVENSLTGEFRGEGTFGVGIENVRFTSSGKLGGRLQIDGSRSTLRGTTPMAPNLGVQPGAVVQLMGSGSTQVSKTVTIRRGGVVEVLDPGAQIVGPGQFDGPATPTAKPAGILRFRSGQVLGTVRTGPRVQVQKAGGQTLTVRTLAADPGRLLVDGPADLSGNGVIAIDALASVRFDGPTRVTGTTDITGLSCCRVTEIPTLTIGGTTTIGSKSRLSVITARLTVEGTLAGPGQVLLSGGLHRLRSGARIATTLEIDTSASVSLAEGPVTLAGELVQTDGDVISAGSGAEFRGRGSWTWVSGLVMGPMAVDVDVTLPEQGTGRRLVGSVTTRGSLGVAGQLDLEGGSRIVVDGIARLIRSRVVTIDSAGAVLSVGQRGRLQVAPLRQSQLDGVRILAEGRVDLQGEALDLGDGRLSLHNGGRFTLEGGILRGDVMTSGGTVVSGPGTITGDLLLGGTLETARRGVISVGTLRPSLSSEIVLRRSAVRADRIEVTGGLEARGRLRLVGFTRPGATPIDLITGPVNRRFATTAGVPNGSEIVYSARAVRLAQR